LKITKLSVYCYSAPLKVPFVTSLRRVDSLEGIIVKIDTSDGLYGLGEGAPTAAITGDSEASIVYALKEIIAPRIVGMDLGCFDSLMDAISTSMVHNSTPKAMADIALHDLRAKALGLPLYKLLGGAKETLETDITISLGEVGQMAADAARAVAEGYRALKVKVGAGSPEADALRAREVRAAASDAEIRIDANQAWTPKEAVAAIGLMEDAGVGASLVEQPVAAGDFEGLRFVRDRIATPVLADESAFSVADVVKILEGRAADMINIKLLKCGGIHEAEKIAGLCETYRVPAFMGCMLEGHISAGAAAHFAAGRRVVEKCDLDGPLLLGDDPIIGGPVFEGPHIRLTGEAGIGVADLPKGAVER